MHCSNCAYAFFLMDVKGKIDPEYMYCDIRYCTVHRDDVCREYEVVD